MIKDDSVLIRNHVDSYLSPIKDIFNQSFYLDLQIVTFFIAMAFLWYVGIQIAGLGIIPFYFLYIVFVYPWFNFLSSIILELCIFMLEMFLFFFMFLTIQYVSDFPPELKITSESLASKRFWIYYKNRPFRPGDSLVFSKRYKIMKYRWNTKIKSYWILMKFNNQSNYYDRFIFKFNSYSNDEIFEIVNLIRKSLLIPVLIDQNNLNVPTSQQVPATTYENSVVRVKQPTDNITTYSLTIKPTKRTILINFYNFFISISICIGIIKFFVKPGLNSITNLAILEFYSLRIIMLIIFLPFFLLRFYGLFEPFNSRITCSFNNKEDKLRISYSKLLRTKNLFTGPLDSINHFTVVDTNLRDYYSIEIDSNPNSFIEYPLRYHDAMEYSLLINKRLSLLKV